MASGEDNFKKWKVPKLRSFVKNRIFESGGNYLKADLVKICEVLKDLDIEERPSAAEQQSIEDDRLKEILIVSANCVLPNPDNPRSGIVWSASLLDYPELNLVQIYEYLIWAKSPYSSDQIKAYKSLKAYTGAVDGFVDQLFVSKDLPKDWAIVRGKVWASERSHEKYDCWVIMTKKGNIRAARCKCTAGLGETCSHVATLIFYVLLVNEHGLNQALTCTEIPNPWLGAKKDSAPTYLTDCTDKVIAKTKNDWVNVPSDRATLKALFDQIAPTGRLAMARRYVPPPRAEERQQTSTSTMDTMDSMPPTIDELAIVFLGSFEEESLDTSTFVLSIKNSITEENKGALEIATRGQSQVGEWGDHRWGRITASKAHKVRQYFGRRGGAYSGRIPCSTLELICPSPDKPNLYGRVKAITHGIDNEANAANDYLELYGPMHLDKLQLESRGLITTAGEGHLGASIDRLATCTCGQEFCNGTWIIEIKCPLKIVDLAPGSAEAIKLYERVSASDNGYVLDESDEYYTQIQMQMGILGIPFAELWIWTPKVKELPLPPVKVLFDEFFWMQLKAYLDVFLPRESSRSYFTRLQKAHEHLIKIDVHM